MSLQPVRKTAIAETIVARLLDLIKERELGPGDKLPPERELAAMLEVSRPSLREALRALSVLNVIEMRQGDGTYVSSLDPGLLVEHLEFVLALDDSTILQLFEARKILEVGIVALAARRITDEEIEALEHIVHTTETVDNPIDFLKNDLELHERITEAARNPILARTMASISQLGLASRRRTTAIPGVMPNTVEDHRRIVAALRARDPEAAQQAMLTHLNQVEQRLIGLADTPETESQPQAGDPPAARTEDAP
jgi:GntR family transcriptional repressor for pyruvate dehydrogenase complex